MERNPEDLLIGLELELMLVDNEGNIVNRGDEVIKIVHALGGPDTITKECAKNMVELGAMAHKQSRESLKSLLDNLEMTMIAANKLGLYVMPLATYPGKYSPEMRKGKGYGIKLKLFGKQRFKIAGRVIGFHFHYDLPFTVPFAKNIFLLHYIDVKHQVDMLNGYNLLTALDPALVTFMQSSPFYQGEFIGKDSRVILYRGSPELKCDGALYAKYPEFGCLQGYKHSIFEITDLIKDNWRSWKNMVRSIGINIQLLTMYGSVLSTAWNPIKVNPKGTLEQRGMDCNHPHIIVATSMLMKFLSKRIYEQGIDVVPHELAIKKPFRLRRRKLYVPPDGYLKGTLQYKAAYEGLESPIVYRYCNNLYKLAMSSMPRRNRKMLSPLKHMLETRKTISDEILDYAKAKGWKKGKALNQKLAAEIAIHHANRMNNELKLSRYMLDRM